MQSESWGSALFRSFQDKTLWTWALLPLVCAGIATWLGMLLSSSSHSFTITGLMKLMVYTSPSTANGLTFANNNFGDTLSIGIWVVLAYLAMAIGFVMIGWLTQDRRNVAGAVIPAFTYVVLQLWLMAVLTPSMVVLGQTAPQSQATGWEKMLEESANALGTAIVNAQPLSLRWGPTFFLMLLMVGLTALAAIVFMVWRKIGLEGLMETGRIGEMTDLQSPTVPNKINWSAVKLPSDADKPLVQQMHSPVGGPMVDINAEGQHTISATQTLAMGLLVQDKPAITQQAVSVTQPKMYCPFDDNELTLLPDGRHMCQKKGWRKPYCDRILEDYREDPTKECEVCHHSLILSDQYMTWHCHNCGATQSIGIGGPWSASTDAIGHSVGV